MATATCQLSEDQFLCSICLDVFTNPVSIPCGHSFCKNCIDRHWSDTVTCKCPLCNQSFNTRPELKVNIFISEMAAQFRRSQQVSGRSQQQAAKPGETMCDVCSDPKLKALKSCMVCLTSYCESHLQPHLSVPSLKRHQLIQPKNDLEERVCKEHNKPLELFCKNDQICVCMLCTYSAHNTHEVVPLKNVSEEKKQELMKTGADIQELIKTREKKIQDLRHSVENNNTAADTKLTEGVKVLTALRESVDRTVENLIQEITGKQEATKHQGIVFIKDLEQEISELKKRRSQIKELSQTDDDLHLLQHFPQLSSPPPASDRTEVCVDIPSYGAIVVRAVSQLEEEFNKMTKELFETELNRVKEFKEYVSLDGDTAHPQLIVSGNEVKHSDEQRNVPHSPNRFDDLFVLGEQCFTKRFYFEADVKGKTEWTLGVAKESVNRKGPLKLSPQNGFWTIGLRDNSYFASGDPEVRLFKKCRPGKVGVFVDYDEGSVCFYDVEAAALIYSFSGFLFNTKLNLICSPGHNRQGNTAPLEICQRKYSWFEQIFFGQQKTQQLKHTST